MEGYQCWGEQGEWGKKVQGIKSIIGRHKIDKGWLRIVQGMEKPKALNVQPVDMD